MIVCYGHYHTCYLAAGHVGDCQSGTGPEHTSAMRHGDIVDSVTAVYEVLRSLGGNRPPWLDDHRAQELRTFRARFTDEEWIMFRSGECGWLTEYGTGREVHCGGSRRHGRIYCDAHTRQARETSSAATYGALSVPSAVSSMDISEVP
jgi:hypothetical protein